ncbi:MAG TPA: FlgD immunoglobulin-like domain containing protein, partial [Candidatus Krumholzibacteria bacterium]|nr:FlgD immunoglobulin-like domain containing protein [Candidatus Krumholzibacteria bacterium]
RLYVGNLSFSTNDGCSAQMGGASGGLIGFMDEAASFPVGGELDLVVRGPAGIDPCVRVARGAAGVLVDPDFSSMGASSYRAEIWNDGAPVATFDGIGGDVNATGFPASFVADLEGVKAPLPDPFPLPAAAAFPISNGFHLRWSTDVTFSIAGGPIATGDELRMVPEGGTGLPYVSSIDVLVTIPPTLPPYTVAIDDIAQQQFGRMHRGTGGATIVSVFAPPIVADRRTTLSHHRGMDVSVGPSAAGGLQVDMHPSQSRDDLIWDLKDGFVTGDQDVLSITAELLTGGQGQVGRVTSVYTGSGWSVTPDFSGSGSPDARVEVFDASGNLMGINPCIIGPFTVASIYWPIETGVEDNETLALVLGYASPVAVDLPGVGIVTGTTIKMHSNATKRHRFFAIIDRTNLLATGGEARVSAEVNGFGLPSYVGEAEFAVQGTAYAKRCHGGLVLHDIDASGTDGVDIEPCLLPAGIPPDQFGIEWAPLGPPSASQGQTDWAFLSQRAMDPGPVQRMAISMGSNGTVVSLEANPGPVQTPEFRVLLKNGGQVVADFMHSDPGVAFAELRDWPIGVGYQELATPDEPWSMWIDLGYEMDVLIQGGGPVNRTGAMLPLTKADLIEVIATNTPNPGPSQRKILSGKFAGIGNIVLLDRGPTPTRIDTAPRSTRTVLRPAYPNPFNPSTTLAFDLAQSGRVSLKIYAVDGSYVATVHEGSLRAGAHAFQWNGVDHRGQPVASGVYLADLRAPDGQLRTKINLLK